MAVFSPLQEAAAVAIFYGLFVGVFIYRTINSFEIIIEILTETAKGTAIVMICGHLRRPVLVGWFCGWAG